MILNKPLRETTCPRGIRPGQIQTRLCSSAYLKSFINSLIPDPTPLNKIFHNKANYLHLFGICQLGARPKESTEIQRMLEISHASIIHGITKW